MDTLGGTRRQWGMQHGGSGFGVADVCVEKRGGEDRTGQPCNSGIIMALHTALLKGGAQDCAEAE